MRRYMVNTVLGGAVLFLGACSTATTQAPSANPSGFLTGKFYKGKDGQALMVYVDPDAQWRQYDKILIDPVTLWSDAETSNLPKGEAQQLQNYLDKSLRRELKKDYTLVDRPGPGVMRLRVAITEAEGSSHVQDTVSAAGSDSQLSPGSSPIAGGTSKFVAAAGIEGELRDAMTNDRLAAAIDRRVGEKSLKRESQTWADIENAFDYWSRRLRARLAQLRSGQTLTE